MKLVLWSLAVLLGSTAFGLSWSETARADAPPNAEQPKPTGPPGVIKQKVGLAPRGIQFGLSLDSIAGLYDRIFEEEFLPRYQTAQPGSEMDAIDEELRQKKLAIRNGKIDFGLIPTGVDYTALKGEYSYGNGESMTHISLKSGTERYFFFFGDKLWKIYDEHKLAPGSSLGENFQQALDNLASRFGSVAKRIEANYDLGLNYDQGLWADPEKYILAVDRGNTLGMVYIDKSIQDNLAKYRKNKPTDQHILDSDVAAATAKPPEAPKKK